MSLVPLLLDLGNIIFFVATFPQLLLTYKNRNSLKDLSPPAFLMFAVATICFLLVSLLTGAIATTCITTFQIICDLITVYWILRSRRK